MSLVEPVRTLAWDHGHAEVQRLGAMLGPVTFIAAGHPDFAPFQVAPWAGESQAGDLPGILRRLRGEWPCVPFGRTDRPPGLPSAWSARDPGDAWGHGFASNHEWQWEEVDAPQALAPSVALRVAPPLPLRRLTRRVDAVPGCPELRVTLEIEAAQACTLPVALHPTLRLDAGSVRLELPPHGGAHAYPVAAEPGVSRLAPGATFAALEQAPCIDGATLDLTCFPLPVDTEELLQLRSVAGPVVLHYLDVGWSLQIDWDRAVLPDVMLWVSHRGRSQPPWSGRHLALGVEPLHAVFDLGRVAAPPPEHGLADRTGLALCPGEPRVLHYRFTARPA
ncbi:MAG: hypothetical protein KF788_22225 [Piscinibacter sp.]|nr:hypothetical protein [Piscinibacter sp.]